MKLWSITAEQLDEGIRAGAGKDEAVTVARIAESTRLAEVFARSQELPEVRRRLMEMLQHYTVMEVIMVAVRFGVRLGWRLHERLARPETEAEILERILNEGEV